MTEDCPLVLPPTENADAALVIQELDQKHERVIRRRTMVELHKSLNSVLQDAWVEIGIAPRLYDCPTYRMMSYGRVSGMPPEDIPAYLIDLKKRYENWRGRMYTGSPVSLSICLRVCQDDDPISQIRADERIGHDTAIRLLQYGLNEYAIISGWNNQIEC